MDPAWLGLLDDVAASPGMQGVRLTEVFLWRPPTLARISISGVVGTSSLLDAEFTAVHQDKGAASWGHQKLVLAKSRRLLAIMPRLHGLRVANSTM